MSLPSIVRPANPNDNDDINTSGGRILMAFDPS